MRGICQQIMEGNTLKLDSSNKFGTEEFKEMLESWEKSYIEARRQKEKNREENFKYLRTRAKELGKEIPFELMFFMDPYLNPSLLVSSEFIEKYKEWL